MKPQEFIDNLSKDQDNYKSTPAIDAQEALDIVTKQLLGDEWTPNMIHTGQCNTEAVYEILKKYPSKQDKRKKRKNMAYNIILIWSYLYFVIMTAILSVDLSSHIIIKLLLYIVFLFCSLFVGNNLKSCAKH